MIKVNKASGNLFQSYKFISMMNILISIYETELS